MNLHCQKQNQNVTAWHVLRLKEVKAAYEIMVLTQHSWILAGAITTPLIHPTSQVKGCERAPESVQVYKGGGKIHVSLLYIELESNDLVLVSWAFHLAPFWKGFREMWQFPAYCHFSHSLAVSNCVQPPSQWENSSLVTFLHRTLGFLQNWGYYKMLWNGKSDSMG